MPPYIQIRLDSVFLWCNRCDTEAVWKQQWPVGVVCEYGLGHGWGGREYKNRLDMRHTGRIHINIKRERRGSRGGRR